MQYILLAIIAILIVYIIFLHSQLVKKNILIESTVKKLSGIEKDWKLDELKSFLEEIKKLNYYSSFFNDKLFEDETLGYMLDNISNTKVYIHYTKEEADAKSILENGFRFVDSFYKTALPISDDKLDLIVKHNSRKYFGNYLILISISNKIISTYSSYLAKAGIKDYFIENVLTESPPTRNENSDLLFLLPKQFVKGYINHTTGEIVKNPCFDPEYASPNFMSNINNLTNGKDKLNS